MATLHRTQVLLERRHYERLKRLAREEGLSLSALLRQILDQSLFQPEKQGQRPNLKTLAGLGRDPHLTGRDHDQALYGRSRSPRRRAWQFLVGGFSHTAEFSSKTVVHRGQNRRRR